MILSAMQDDGDTDAELEEVVTPCEEVEFSLLLGGDKATRVEAAVTVVEGGQDAQED